MRMEKPASNAHGCYSTCSERETLTYRILGRVLDPVILDRLLKWENQYSAGSQAGWREDLWAVTFPWTSRTDKVLS